MLAFLKALRPEFRPTIGLALPLVIAEVGWMTMGVVDTIMVGRLPNSAVAIGATGLGQSLYNIVSIFGACLLLGLDTFFSQATCSEDMQVSCHDLVLGVYSSMSVSHLLLLQIYLF